MRASLLYAVLFLVPFFGGCVRTLQPILKDDQVSPIDQSLFGKWVSKEGTETLEVSAAEKERTYRAVYQEAGGKKLSLLVRLGKVGDLTLAELCADDLGPEMSDVGKFHFMPVYSFLVVKETSPRFEFATMAQDWLKKYLDQHPTDLQFARRDDDVLVTAPTADFQAFLLKHYKDDGAIGEPNAFVRPADRTTQPAAPAK